MTQSLKDLEKNKFLVDSTGAYDLTANGNSVVVVSTQDLVFGIDYDNIAVAYPTTVQEIYVYSLSAVTIRTVTVDYSDTSKNELTNVGVA
jgi:hypothetical protein